MCGKFTAMASWGEVVDFSDPLTAASRAGSNDSVETFRPMTDLPVILRDPDSGKRRVVKMRWGFPARGNPNRPDPIHARGETLERLPTFADAFHTGQRGIVVFRTFNEGREAGKRTEQWTIDPGDGIARGFAFLWRRFELPGLPAPLLACVMVTAPASELIAPITDRMPAIVPDEDWARWLGEVPAATNELKACLRTVDNARWTMAPEKPPRTGREPVNGDSTPELF
jgi:putative SOS response-associated peptidase YedK